MWQNELENWLKVHSGYRSQTQVCSELKFVVVLMRLNYNFNWPLAVFRKTFTLCISHELRRAKVSICQSADRSRYEFLSTHDTTRQLRLVDL